MVKMGVLFNILGEAYGYGFPLFGFFLSLLVPCHLPFIGSLILPLDACAGISHWTLGTGIIAGFMLPIIETVGMVWCVNVAILYTIVGLMDGLLFLWIQANQVFSRKGFSLKYREIQVSENLYNCLVRWRIFPTTIVIAMVIQIFTCFILLAYVDKVATVIHLIILVAALLENVFFSLSFLSVSGRLHSKSKTWIQHAKQGNLSKYQRKCLKSFKCVRIYFGTNFVDEMTPIRVQMFCITTAIKLLLMSR